MLTPFAFDRGLASPFELQLHQSNLAMHFTHLILMLVFQLKLKRPRILMTRITLDLQFNIEQFDQIFGLLKCQFLHLVLFQKALNTVFIIYFLGQRMGRHGQLLIITLITQIYSLKMSLLDKIAQIEQPQSSVIRPLRPLVFNFFVSDRPQANQQTLEDVDVSYRSFHSTRLQQKNNHYFRPTINPKKLNEEPRFRLSLQKKRSKVLKGTTQRASSEKPSRNSYRGSKLKTTNNRSMINQQEWQPAISPKQQKVVSPEMASKSLRKSKQPHLHFNLRHLLQTSKIFTGQFSKQDNIQGTSFPYYNYFSSQKFSFPRTQKSHRGKLSKVLQSQRYISSTVAMRQFSYNF